ncbi:MAG: DUF4351 domain-containing protein [Nostoc sp.]|uniref:DUF4351 domain-containing protein n=1 Tax=Nostoc sp. TaxID=1180 RepID=UPI002FF9F358
MEEGVRSLVLRLLKRLFGKIAKEVLAKIYALSLEQLEALALALLDFCAIANLEEWLQGQPRGSILRIKGQRELKLVSCTFAQITFNFAIFYGIYL